jgi:nucleotide-binding universal stress UspA family protein
MFEQVLFPTDGSEGAAFAFDHVLDLAATHDATVHVLSVADTTNGGLLPIRGDDEEALRAPGDRLVREAAERARERGVETVTAVRQGAPYREIVDYAGTNGVDLVVMSTHGRRGLERFLLGSTSERVVRRADVPVLTIRPDDDVDVTHPYRDVLVPTDGSDCAKDALALGADVAAAEDAALHLLTVVAIAAVGADVRADVQLDQLKGGAHELLDEAATAAEARGVEAASRTVEYGPSVHEAILAYIDGHDVDVVVVGTHGRTGFDRFVLGSVTAQLVRTAPIPVLTVPSPDADT